MMKRLPALCALTLMLTMALTPSAFAAESGTADSAVKVCYPTAISRNEDGTELRKMYDLSPEDDPAGIRYCTSKRICSPSSFAWMEEMGDSKESMIRSEMGSSNSL